MYEIIRPVLVSDCTWGTQGLVLSWGVDKEGCVHCNQTLRNVHASGLMCGHAIDQGIRYLSGFCIYDN